MRVSLRIIVALMLLLSFVTHTLDINSSNLIVSRMTVSDIFGLLAIALFFLTKIIKKNWNFELPDLYKKAALAIGCLSLSVFTSLSIKSTVFELIILCYLMLISYLIFELFKNHLQKLIGILVLTTLLVSIICLYDLIAVNIGFTTFFYHVEKNFGGSSFRYFGQAANYSFTFLTILIPLKYSSLSKNFSSIKMKIINVAIVLTILLLFSTGRLSIIISFFIAIITFIIYTRKLIILKDFFRLLLMNMCFFIIAIYRFPNVLSNIKTRIQLRITDRQEGNLASDFIIDNFKGTFVAFMDNPLFGSGLGGFVNNYSVYEIHGTYLKMIGETGLIGLAGYMVFLVIFVRTIVKTKINYFYFFLPFLIGSLVSWGYNYHLRKKEFWILFAFVAILQFISEKKKMNNLNGNLRNNEE